MQRCLVAVSQVDSRTEQEFSRVVRRVRLRQVFRHRLSDLNSQTGYYVQYARVWALGELQRIEMLMIEKCHGKLEQTGAGGR